MRSLLSVLSCVLMLVSIAKADELPGSWLYSNKDTGETISVTFNADGTGDFDGDAIKYIRKGEQLIVSLPDEQLIYTIQITGDTLLASDGDLEGKLTFVRKGAANKIPPQEEQPAAGNPLDPAPVQAKTESTIVGTWTDGQGKIGFNADGSCDYVGQKATYEYDGTTLKIHGSAGDAEMKVVIDGDTFIATIGDQVQKLSRVKAGEQRVVHGADGVAGVYMYSEASVDPTNVMVITQYLTLYPDGTIGWFKTELGASRTQVTDCLERFASFKTNPQNKGRTYGTWQADAQGNISLQWTIWNNVQCNGRLNAQTGKLTVEKMGILNEGATLTYDRQ